MKRVATPLVASLLGLAACADAPTALPGGASPGDALRSASGTPAAPTFMLLLRGNDVPANLAARVAAAGGQLVSTIPQVGIAIATAADGQRFAAAMRRDAAVQDVAQEPVAALPETLDSALPAGEEWTAAATPAVTLAPTPGDDLYNNGLVWGVQRVNAPLVWPLGAAYTGDGATVGIIDTGIASNHPDLAGRIVFNSCYSSAGDVVGRHWVAGDPCIPYPSASDHGTHVAGTVAASFGGSRVVGVAPNAQLYNYNTFEVIPGCGVCTFASSRWRAMIHAADNGVDVINMSLGSFFFIGNDPKKRGEAAPVPQNGTATFLAFEKRVANYVTQRGTVIVSSAGNSGANLNGTWVAAPGEVQGHITVGSTGVRPAPRYVPGVSTDVRSFFSNFGAAVDIVAPGGDCGVDGGCPVATRPANWFEHLVLSAIVAPNVTCARTRTCGVGFGWKAGTSMAAPHVAGGVAIVRAVHPELTAAQAANVVQRTAQSLGDRQQFGSGMLDVAAAVR